MATFFGSEALVSYEGFNTAISGVGVIYTVPTGFYAKILVQEFRQNTLGSTLFAAGDYPGVLVDAGIGGGTPVRGPFEFEIFQGQTFRTVTFVGSAQVTWSLKLYAAP